MHIILFILFLPFPLSKLVLIEQQYFSLFLIRLIRCVPFYLSGFFLHFQDAIECFLWAQDPFIPILSLSVQSEACYWIFASVALQIFLILHTYYKTVCRRSDFYVFSSALESHRILEVEIFLLNHKD